MDQLSVSQVLSVHQLLSSPPFVRFIGCLCHYGYWNVIHPHGLKLWSELTTGEHREAVTEWLKVDLDDSNIRRIPLEQDTIRRLEHALQVSFLALQSTCRTLTASSHENVGQEDDEEDDSLSLPQPSLHNNAFNITNPSSPERKFQVPIILPSLSLTILFFFFF